MEDAQRDPLTGEFPDELRLIAPDDAAHDNDEDAACSEGEEVEELSQHTNASDDGGDTTDEDEGEPFHCPADMKIVAEYPEDNARPGLTVAHRFDVGWFKGQICRKVTLSARPEENGRWACKYPDRRKEYFHDLFPEDYGVSKMWVIVEKI